MLVRLCIIYCLFPHVIKLNSSGNWLGKEKPAMVKEFSDSAVSDVDPKEEDVRGPVLSVAETKGYAWDRA